MSWLTPLCCIAEIAITMGGWFLFLFHILRKYIPHYNDDIMDEMAPQIASLPIVYSTVYSGADQRKHQNSASLAFVRGIHRWSVNSCHKWPVTRKTFPFDDGSWLITVITVTTSWTLVNRACVQKILFASIIIYPEHITTKTLCISSK